MQFDHLAVSAYTLAEASDHIEQALGVALQDGGQHGVFGTHNRLLGLADGLYLEAMPAIRQCPTPAERDGLILIGSQGRRASPTGFVAVMISLRRYRPCQRGRVIRLI